MIIFEFMKFENINKLKQLIDNSNNIVIIPHTNPDGDAVGSCLALHFFFKAKTTQINGNSFFSNFNFPKTYIEGSVSGEA